MNKRQRSHRSLRAAILLTLLLACTAQPRAVDRQLLEGAWTDNGPSFAFVIGDSTVLYEFDMRERPYSLAGDTLVVDLGPDLGVQRKRIVALTPDSLVLQDGAAAQPTTFRRME